MVENEYFQKLKEIKEQQEMLDYILNVVAKSTKDNFPFFVKLVQADVLKVVLSGAKRDDKMNDDMLKLSENLDALMRQIGKDIQENITARFIATKEELCKK